MRLRTRIALGGFVLALGGLVVLGFGVPSGGELTEAWVSDTPRDNEVNHHAVGAGPDGDVVVAPVAAVPGSDVTFSNTSCALVRLRPEDGSARWRNGVPPDDCFTHALTEPAIEDVDGDGSAEVITSTTEGAVTVIDAETGREEVRAPLATYGYGRPTTADLLPTAGREILTSDIQGNVVLVRANGSLAWQTPLNRTFDRRLSVWDAPTVRDVDADGDRDIVVGTNAGPVVLSPNGTPVWSTQGKAKDIVVAQGDSDPQLELFTAGTQTIRSIDGRDRETEWDRRFGAAPRMRTVADGDGDGTLELYLGLSDGKVISVDAGDGSVEWSTQVSPDGSTSVTAPVVANVDGQGPPEVVATTRGGTVSVLDAGGGAELAAYERNVQVLTFPTPVDIDDDGRPEILVRYGDGRVVALAYSS